MNGYFQCRLATDIPAPGACGQTALYITSYNSLTMLRTFIRRRRRNQPRPAMVGPIVLPIVSDQVPAALLSAAAPGPQTLQQSPPADSPKLQRKPTMYQHKSIRSVRSNRSTVRLRGLMDSVKDELTCSICLDEYVEPRLLQCGHRQVSLSIKLEHQLTKKLLVSAPSACVPSPRRRRSAARSVASTPSAPRCPPTCPNRTSTACRSTTPSSRFWM